MSEVRVILVPAALAVTGTWAGILLFINCTNPAAIAVLFSATKELNAEPFTLYSYWVPLILTLTRSSISNVPDTVNWSTWTWLLFCPPEIADTISPGTSNLPSSALKQEISVIWINALLIWGDGLTWICPVSVTSGKHGFPEVVIV